MPGHSTIENCWYNNPDGARFYCMPPRGTVHIEKGFMSLKALKTALKTA